MGIGRRYWTIASLLCCLFYCTSHYEEYPNRGWAPHAGWGNRYQYRREQQEREEKAREQAQNRKKAQGAAAEVEASELERARVNAKRAEEQAKKSSRADGALMEGVREGKGRVKEVDEMEDRESRPPTSTSTKRSRSDRRSDGDDHTHTRKEDEAADEVRGDLAEASIEPLLTPSKLGLRSRRLNASPEKFDKRHFEPLSIRPPDDRPAKKRRLEANVEITYDSAGTPRLSAFPRTAADGDEATLRAGDGPRLPITARRISADSTSSLTTLTTTELLNTPTTAQSTHPKKKRFSLIHAICKHDDVLIHLVSFLAMPSLISLYAISKPFHYLFNRTHTAFILSSMRTWAPDADKIFPWRCYKSLCVKDPSQLQKPRLAEKENEVDRKWDDLRDVPSLKWLQMVVWREGVCRDMMIVLATEGLRIPWGTLESVKKMWFLMDLPLNSQRIALIHNKEYMPDGILLGMTFFLLKVDCLLTDPLAQPHPTNHPNQRLYPNKYAGGMLSGVPLRKLLLAERHLSALWRVMRGWSWDSGFGTGTERPLNRLDILRLWIRHKYSLTQDADAETKKMSIMGIPWHEVGTVGLERTGVAFHDLTNPSNGTVLRTVPIVNPAIVGSGLNEHQADQMLYPHRRRIILKNEKPREVLLRPDELLLREGVRRKLKMHKLWWKALFYGFCDGLGRALRLPTEEEVLERLRDGKGKGKKQRKGQ